jgi:tetratricopeptide (TPR) repeat protein
MPRHHFLPASFLGLFSSDKRDIPLRRKVLTIANKMNGKIFNGPASQIGCINNFYKLTDAPEGIDPGYIDEIWTKYESELPSAVNQLVNQNIDTEQWARVLVPFVACLLLRGPDFDFRLKRRFASMGINYKDLPISLDSTNLVRPLELQRLLSPILTSKWIVLSIHGQENLITNDLGYAPFWNRLIGDSGMAIPLGLRHILIIVPQLSRTITRSVNGKWIPIIEYQDEPTDSHNKLNETLARNAQRFICGSNEDTIRGYFRLMQTFTYFSPDPPQLGFIAGKDARAQEFTWHRFISSLGKTPDEINKDGFPIDWEVISKGWHPPVSIPTNLVEFPPFLHLVGKDISVEYYDPEIYYIISDIKMRAEISDFQGVIDESSIGLKLALPGKQIYQLLINRADAYIELGLYKAGYHDYEDAIIIDKSNPVAFINQGYAFAKEERINEAIISFTHAIELDLLLGVPYLNRGSMYGKINKYDDALNDLARAIDLIKENNNKADAYFTRGSILLLANRDQEGIQELGFAIPLYDDPVKISNCYYKLAIAHYTLKNIDEAINCLSIALKKNPSLFEALSFRAQIYKENEQYLKALDDLNLALPLSANTSDKVNILHLSGIVYSELEQFEKAESCFNQGLNISEDKSRFWYAKGNLFLIQGKLDFAIECFKSAISIQPKYAAALNNLGICFALQNEHTEAINYFDQSLTSSPNDADKASAYRNKAISLSYLNDRDRAYISLAAAGEIQPDSFNYLVAKGRIQIIQNKYKSALRTAKFLQSKQIEKGAYPLVAISMAALGNIQDSTLLFQLWLKDKPLPLIRLIVLSDLIYLQQKSKHGDEIQSIITILRLYSDK